MVTIHPIRSQLWIKIFRCYRDNEGRLYAEHRPVPNKPPESEMNWGVLDRLHQAGFTLIELMIAIAMVGILATIAIPNILSEMPKFRLNGATQQVLWDLMAARMRAVSHNKKVKVSFTDGGHYKICDDPFDSCVKIVNIQDNYKGVNIDIENDTIFHPRGTASNMTIPIRNTHGCKSIKIAITGRIKIDSASCS